MSAENQESGALITAWYDGVLDAAGQAELERRLIAEPAVALRFAEAGRLHHALSAVSRAAASEAPRTAVSGRRPSRRLRRSALAGPRPWWGVAAAAAALALLVLWAGGERRPALARIDRVASGASIDDAGARRDAAAGDELRGGERLRTAAAGGGTLRYRDGSTVEVAASSQVALAGSDEAKQVRVEAGAVRAEITPQPTALLVQAGPAEVASRAGSVAVTLAGDAATVASERGDAELRRPADGLRLPLPAGHQATLTADNRPQAVRIPAPAAAAMAVPAGPITGFALIDIDSNQPLAGVALVDGAVIDLARLPTRRLNVQALCTPARLPSVGFTLDRDGVRLIDRFENDAPYGLVENGRTGNFGAYGGWTPEPGSYVLTATPYAKPSRGGTPGPARRIAFTIVDGARR